MWFFDMETIFILLYDYGKFFSHVFLLKKSVMSLYQNTYFFDTKKRDGDNDIGEKTAT